MRVDFFIPLEYKQLVTFLDVCERNEVMCTMDSDRTGQLACKDKSILEGAKKYIPELFPGNKTTISEIS